MRGLPVLVCAAPEFDPARAPDNPVELFTAWLLHAIDSGVAEPHAMTVSTASGSRPSARVLILKDVDDAGWQSEPYCDPAEVGEALAKARLELDRSPGLVPADWVSYAVQADTVEFWQSDPARRHQRRRCERDVAGWSATLLWP